MTSVAAKSADYDPFDLDGQQSRSESARRKIALAAEQSDQDLVWMLSDVRGRRVLRRRLSTGGMESGHYRSSYHQNYGQMCFNEGLRTDAMELMARVMKLLAAGEIPLQHYQLLMTEED